MSSKLLDRIYNILHPEKPAESDIIDKIYDRVDIVEDEITLSKTQLVSFFEKMLGCPYGGVIQNINLVQGETFYEDNLTGKLFIYKDLKKTDTPIAGVFTGLESNWIPFDLINQKIYSYVTLFNNDDTDVGNIIENISNVLSGLVTRVNDIESNINAKIDALIPIGTVLVGYFPEDVDLPGIYIDADGSILDKNEYPETFDIFGYNFGGFGDNFRIIDVRGEHLRFADMGRGIDAGRILGTFQAHQLLKHKHDGITAVNGNHQHITPWGEAGGGYWGTYGGNSYQGSASTDYDNILFLTSPEGDHSHTLAIDYVGSDENRVRNIALRAILRVG